jgi:GNAT superfamily N-acetyltransferase
MIETDIPELSRLYEQFRNEKSDIGKMQRIFHRIHDNDRYPIFNAFFDNRLVGSISGIQCDELYGDCSPFMVIENFIVDADYRRKGIGRLLYAEMESCAIKNGCCNILLVTDTSRTDAMTFYESIGFDKTSHKGYKKSLIS